MIINLIDVSGFMYRSFFAIKTIEFGALYGICSEFINLLIKFPDATFVAACDSGKKTFKNDIYAEYKAHRPTMPENLVKQLPLINNAITAFGFCKASYVGFEADDIIASFAKKFKNSANIINIMSYDKDLIQLMSNEENINVYNLASGEKYSEQDVLDKFGVNPAQFLDYLALVGDQVDNVPGASGIGPKTAALLLKEFGNLDNILANRNNLPNYKRYDGLRSNVERVLLSKKLVKLYDDIDVKLEQSERDFDEIFDFLQQYKFYTLANKIKRCFQN